jgi:Zn-finger nucleic acid-binding protein
MRADDAGGLACGHCGTVDPRAGLFYDLETAGATSLACPQCRTALVEARIEANPVRYCPSCHGVLVEMKHFVALTDSVRAREPRTGVALPRRQRPGDHVLACPLCAQPMLSHLYGGPGNLVIDTCESCAVNWLDHGELRRIARAP